MSVCSHCCTQNAVYQRFMYVLIGWKYACAVKILVMKRPFDSTLESATVTFGNLNSIYIYMTMDVSYASFGS